MKNGTEMKKSDSFLKRTVVALKGATLLFVALVCGVTGSIIQENYRVGFWLGHSYGYHQGQVKLSQRIIDAIGMKISKTNFDHTRYKFFKEIDGIRYYIYQGKELKTLVVLE